MTGKSFLLSQKCAVEQILQISQVNFMKNNANTDMKGTILLNEVYLSDDVVSCGHVSKNTQNGHHSVFGQVNIS